MNYDEKVSKAVSEGKELPQVACFFGDAFTGKTTAAANFARRYKLKWIDCDMGSDAIMHNLPKEYWGNIDVIQIPETMENSIAYATVTKLLKSRAPVKISDLTGEVNCIKTTKAGGSFSEWNPAEWDTGTILVIDSLTKLLDSITTYVLGSSDGFNFKKKEFSHYDRQGLMMRNLFALAKALPCHVIFITHQEELELEDGSNKLVPVAGTRNFSTQVGRYFSHQVHFSVKNMKHKINSSTTKENNVQAGTRAGKDLDTLDKLLDLFSVSKE